MSKPDFLRHVKVNQRDRRDLAPLTDNWVSLKECIQTETRIVILEKILVIKLEQGAKAYQVDKIRARLSTLRREEETRQLQKASKA